MKVLLDECLPLDFRHSFPEHEAHTAEWAGLKGKKNGELLQAAARAGYEVLITVDQGIPREPRMHDLKLSIILIRARSGYSDDVDQSFRSDADQFGAKRRRALSV